MNMWDQLHSMSEEDEEDMCRADPRLAGFNYGAGWGSDPKPPIYHQAEAVARALGEEMMRLSREQWGLEMALRRVRLAQWPREKAIAVAALEVSMEKYKPAIAAE